MVLKLILRNSQKKFVEHFTYTDLPKLTREEEQFFYRAFSNFAIYWKNTKHSNSKRKRLRRERDVCLWHFMGFGQRRIDTLIRSSPVKDPHAITYKLIQTITDYFQKSMDEKTREEYKRRREENRKKLTAFLGESYFPAHKPFKNKIS